MKYIGKSKMHDPVPGNANVWIKMFEIKWCVSFVYLKLQFIQHLLRLKIDKKVERTHHIGDSWGTRTYVSQVWCIRSRLSLHVTNAFCENWGSTVQSKRKTTNCIHTFQEKSNLKYNWSVRASSYDVVVWWLKDLWFYYKY
jgi:hypothetical protein